MHPLIERLRTRRAEIERAVLTRVAAIDDAPSDKSASSSRLVIAVSAGIEYGICTIERSEDFAPAPPPALLVQARTAAREGIGLDALLLRYLAGYGLFWDFVLEEYEREEDDLGDHSTLKRWHRTLQAVSDHLVAILSEEYAREVRDLAVTPEDRLARHVAGLLAGKRLDTSRIPYDFDAHHLGAVARGPEAPSALRAVAKALDAQLLLLRRPDDTAWGWIGSRRDIDPTSIDSSMRSVRPPHTVLALGEPAAAIEGWRRTHREAKAAFAVASRTPCGVTRYSDAPLLSAALRDELLAATLRRLYLKPLLSGPQDRQVLLPAVRAYIEAEFNISSAAAALRADRHTVRSRIRRAEARLGRPLASCVAELSVALSLDALDASSRGTDRL